MNEVKAVESSRLDTPGRKAVFLASMTLLVLSIVLPLSVWVGGVLTLTGAALALGLVVQVVRTPQPV